MKKNISIEKDEHKLKQSQQLFSTKIDYNALNTLTHGQYSHNSLLSMVNDWNRFIEFCQLKQKAPLPALVDTIKIFIKNEAKKRKFSSIRRYRLTISLIHELHTLDDPTNHRQIHFLLSELQQQKKGDATQAMAFTKEHLEQLDQLIKNSPALLDKRDRLIYYLMFECALKRRQLRQLTRDNLYSNNDKNYFLTIDNYTYPLSDELSLQIDAWFAILPPQAKVLFVRIDRHENIGTEPMDDSSIYRVFRRASERLKLPKHQQFSGQSSRIGAAKDKHLQGLNLKEVQSFGRWSSPVMPAQYLGKHELAEQEISIFRKPKPWK